MTQEVMIFLDENGMLHGMTIAHNPWQNNVVERLNRTLVDLVRSMLHHNGRKNTSGPKLWLLRCT